MYEFKPITKRETKGIADFIGRLLDSIVRKKAQPNPKLAKPVTVRPETRHYTKAYLLRRWNKRGERRPLEGELAGALLALTTAPESTLGAIRGSRERLDGMHGAVLDIAPRLRDLCWAIDSAEATNAETTADATD